jgi:hypothetical protein
MLRRPLFSQETEYSHQSSPRKWRTIARPTTFHQSIMRPQRIYTPPSSGTEYSWIGKFLIPYQSFNFDINPQKCVSEYEIMKKCGMYSYRIIFVIPVKNKDNKISYLMKSKPTIEYRPGQLNVYVTPDMLIVGVQYF